MFIPLPTRILGIDFSDYCLKAVEINHGPNGKSIKAINNLKISEGLIEEGIIKNEIELTALIKKLISDAEPSFNSKYTVVSLPEAKTFIKVINISTQTTKTDDLEIEKSIRQELPRHIPINIDEMQIDWQVVENGQKQKKILVAAVPKATVNSLLRIYQKAGLKIIALEVEAQAIGRCLIKHEQTKRPIASSNLDGFLKQNQTKPKRNKIKNTNKNSELKIILDLGATKTNIILIDDGLIQFSQDLNSINGIKLSRQIAEKKDLSFKEAEKIKINYGRSKKSDAEVEEVIDSFTNELTRAIIQAFDFYQQHFNKETAQAKVVLCGGGANLGKIDKKISQRLKKEVIVGDPLINLSGDLPKKINNPLSYTTAIGLALRNNFEF